MRTALLVLVLGLVVAGCDSIDPTEQFFSIRIENDTHREVGVDYCRDGRCTALAQHVDLLSGEWFSTNISDREILERYAVTDASGRRIGCLLLEFGQKYEHVVVHVSQAIGCPGNRPLTVRKGKPLGRS